MFFRNKKSIMQDYIKLVQLSINNEGKFYLKKFLFIYQPFLKTRQYIGIKENERGLILKKKEADIIIGEYIKPLYGFSMIRLKI